MHALSHLPADAVCSGRPADVVPVPGEVTDAVQEQSMVKSCNDSRKRELILNLCVTCWECHINGL